MYSYRQCWRKVWSCWPHQSTKPMHNPWMVHNGPMCHPWIPWIPWIPPWSNSVKWKELITCCGAGGKVWQTLFQYVPIICKQKSHPRRKYQFCINQGFMAPASNKDAAPCHTLPCARSHPPVGSHRDEPAWKLWPTNTLNPMRWPNMASLISTPD